MSGPKRVKFNDIDENGQTWQDIEIQKLDKKLKEVTKERNTLKEKLNEKNYDKTYKENQMLKTQL